MKIQNGDVSKGNIFELNFSPSGDFLRVYDNEKLEQMNGSTLTPWEGEQNFVLTLRGLKINADGSINRLEEDGTRFSRSFVVHPKGADGNRVFLEVEREIPSGDEE